MTTHGGVDQFDGNRPLPFDRETLGRAVRDAWVRWARAQPEPKPSWLELVPFEQMGEVDKEAERQIGESVARMVLVGDAARASLVRWPLGSSPETDVGNKETSMTAHEQLGDAEHVIGNVAIKQAIATLDLVRQQYGEDVHRVVKALRAHAATDVDTALWMGAAQAYSAQINIQMMYLDDLLARLEHSTRERAPDA